MNRSGFTLVEVLVSLAVGGLALGLVAGVFQATTGSLRSLERSAADQARRMNGALWLAESLASVRTDTTGAAARFDGQSGSVSFATWDRVPRGWSEPVRLRVAHDGGGLVASGGRQRVVLRDSVREVRFDYLGEGGADAVWRSAWGEEGAPPSAVRLRILDGRSPRWDTLLFVVGGGRTGGGP